MAPRKDPSPSDALGSRSPDEPSTADQILGDAPAAPVAPFNSGLVGGGSRPPSGSDAFERWLAGVMGESFIGPATDHPAETRTLADTIDMSGLGAGRGSSMGDVLGKISNLSQAQLSHLQRRLFQGGFYTAAVYANAGSINWGMMDNLTVTALQQAVQMAGINQVDDFDQFLEQQRIQFGQTGQNIEGQDVGGALTARREVNVVLADPDSIRLIAERAGTELLGRKPTEQELSKITDQLWAEQRAAARVPATADEARLQEGGELTATLLNGQSPFAGTYQAGDPGQLDAEQLAVASTVIKVGQEMGLGEEYIVAALSAGLVESDLRNLDYGDRDSVGVFQQRPSQGWGSVGQIRDVNYAARKFYEAMLVAKPGSNLGEWVANTQRPAEKYRGRYAEVMDQAAGIAQAILSGGGQGLANRDPNRIPLPPDPIAGRHGLPQRTGRPLPNDTTGLAQEREPRRPRTSSMLTPIGRSDEGGEAPWFSSMLGNSNQDPIYREQFAVDPQASIEMAVREADPVAYQTAQAARRTYEFFALLGAGGA